MRTWVDGCGSGNVNARTLLQYVWLMRKTMLHIIALALAVVLAAPTVVAAPVAPDGAVRVAESWRGGAARHLGRGAGVPSGRVRTFSENGTNLFHLVALKGGGFVAVPADDDFPGVMAFSPSGELPAEDDGGPLWAMLAADGGAAVGGSGGANPSRRRSRDRARPSRPRLKAVEATVAPAKTAVRAYATSGVSSIGDVRVAPLVKSKWNQGSVGDKTVYNFFTPSNYVCGCVATAMAQLMRFHRFPAASVTPQTFTCYVGSINSPVSLTMKGGVYDWDSMPLKPTSSITDAQREMIGRLCYDAGVSARMTYSSSGSGTVLPFVLEPLKSVFGYASADSYMVSGTLNANEIKAAILANLDAGYPVLLGIDDNGSNGHAIVADGYGYEGETLWCHLNMGWSGSSDLWYALPDMKTSNYSFNAVNSVVYNVFPTGSGEIVSGRVTDEDGNPLEGATVSAVVTYTERTWVGRQWKTVTVTNEVLAATTSATGIYSVLVPTNRTYSVSVSATYGDGASSAVATTNSPNSSPFDLDWETRSYYYSPSGLSVGNSWGNDLTVTAAEGEAAAVTSFSAASLDSTDGFSLSFSGTGGAKYEVQYATNLVDGSWSPATNILLAPAGSTTIFLPVGDDPAGFWRIVPAHTGL